MMSSLTEARFYGRRKGRTLRVHKTYLMNTLLPSFVLHDSSKIDFSPETWLEIGFGGGEHLAELAHQHPQVQFIGCEAFENGVASLLQHIEQRELKNVSIYPNDVRPFLKSLPDACVHKIFIMFPDPWPKTRQHKRRLVNKEFFQQILRILKPQGEFRFASDHQDYVENVRALIQATQSFSKISVMNEKPANWPLTRYNQKALQAAMPSWYLQADKDSGK